MNNLHQPWVIARRDVPDSTDLECVQHIVQAIDRLKELAASYTPAELLTEEVPQNAGCRSFGIMAEAAAGTSLAFRRADSVINWDRWKLYGRRLIHEYYRVNYKRLWTRWQPEALVLRKQLLAVLPQEKMLANV